MNRISILTAAPTEVVNQEDTRTSMYSSEIVPWSDKDTYLGFLCDINTSSCLLAGNALYFMTGNVLYFITELGLGLIKLIDALEYHSAFLGIVMTAEGGGLGLGMWRSTASTSGRGKLLR